MRSSLHYSFPLFLGLVFLLNADIGYLLLCWRVIKAEMAY